MDCRLRLIHELGMLQLTLLRHAKAVPGDEGVDDFARKLADRGRTDAPVTAAALAAEGANPLVVLVSDAARTRETWDLARPHFPRVEVRFLPQLYLCPAEILMAEAEKAQAERVMLVGHNPGLHELASRLASRKNELESRLRAKFPTAAGAIFERKSVESSWKLQTYVTPKTLSD